MEELSFSTPAVAIIIAVVVLFIIAVGLAIFASFFWLWVQAVLTGAGIGVDSGGERIFAQDSLTKRMYRLNRSRFCDLRITRSAEISKLSHDTSLHLGGGFSSERDGKNLVGREAIFDDLAHIGRHQNPRLSRTCARPNYELRRIAFHRDFLFA